MRNSILALALSTTLIAAPAVAQDRAEITPFVGWQFGGWAAGRSGDFRLSDDVAYGGILDIAVRPGAQAEFMYSRQETQLLFDDFLEGRRVLTDMTVEFIHGGGLVEIDRGHRAKPFVSATLGATHFNPEQSVIDGVRVDDEWRFSFTLGAGVKIFPSQRLGIRLQGHFMSTFLDTGGSIFCGGGGCSFGLFGYGIYQGSVSGGVTLAI
ncbi:MAG: hypothetical protein JSU87_04485 [Gemmatimonadota bacterium]|nr:MAG: hypothetical protein JSU87_04485 [Gemmatimonadota bacterium]